MNPGMSERNRVPTTTELGSPSSTGTGTTPGVQIEHGQTTGGGGAAAVVNVQVAVAAIALPATSFTRGSVAPPLTIAV